MYNLFKYINDKHKSQAQLKKTKKESEYQLRHEEFKKKAFENMKERADQFLYNQVTAESPFTFEDDHYRTWRQKKQFRDVENADKFLEFKTFRHRPNEDMDKFYTPRERKQMEYLATKKEDLVRSGVLTSEEVSRSQRSQGPFNPKIEFRVTKDQKECLQPRLRFANITDKQRMSESATNFQQRVQKIYKKFQTSKDKLGKMKSSMSRYYDETSSGIHSGQFYKKSQSLKKPSQPQNPENNERDMSILSSTKMSQYFEQRNQARRKSKIYFKLTKTMQMLHPDPQKRQEFDSLLKRSQYDRLRDLHNIRHNTFNENHYKDPIL